MKEKLKKIDDNKVRFFRGNGGTETSKYKINKWNGQKEGCIKVILKKNKWWQIKETESSE